MGVLAMTGETHPPLTENILHHIGPDSPAALERSLKGKVLAVDSSVDSPMDLRQAGWCTLFASDADPNVRAALQCLLDWREKQVNNERRFRVFAEVDGVKPNQSAASWARDKGVSLTAPVSPDKGVPYYLLIVGSPQRISFEFQQQFDLQWAVGRLHFDRLEDYASYAQKVIDYERGLCPPQSRRTVLWMPLNPLDQSTPLLVGTIAPDFLGKSSANSKPLGEHQKFQITGFVGDGQATKAKLGEILRGKADGTAPSILFTGSHGAEWPIDDPTIQRQRQGALVTQSWIRGRPLQPDDYFAAQDVPDDAQVHGLMYFMFACFGGGCPEKDSYCLNKDGSKIPLTPVPFVSALPQALLSRGALAVIAHVDRAFSYVFEDVMGTSQSQLIRTPLELLMRGQRVGLASDALNQQWSSLAAILDQAQRGNLPGMPQPPSTVIANLFTAKDEARNYVVLGDPATRLDVDGMK
jgi:hypothetical protein